MHYKPLLQLQVRCFYHTICTSAIAKNSPPPTHRICRSCQPSLTTHPPPTMAIIVHSTWPSTPPSTIGRAEGALGWEVRRRKENWEWSPISVASAMQYVCTNSDTIDDDEAEAEAAVDEDSGEAVLSLQSAVGCCSLLQLSRYVSYSICRPKNTQAADATPLSSVRPQLVDTLALTVDSAALSTANVAAAALEPNRSVRLSAERREVEAGRDDDTNRVERNVLSPNSAMKIKHREDRNEERKEDDEDRGDERREEAEEGTEEAREEREEREEEEREEAALVIAVRLCNARSDEVTTVSAMEGADGRGRSEESTADEEEMVVKRRARGTREAETSSGL